MPMPVARSIISPYRRAKVLTAVMQAAVTVGDHEQVQMLAQWAKAMGRAVTDSSQPSQALAALAGKLAAAGDLDHAEIVADAIIDPFWRAAEQCLKPVDPPGRARA
jgi:hypothetical protein